MQPTVQRPITLQIMHEELVLLADIFCEKVCSQCQWTSADFYFHLHNPGNLQEAEIVRINKVMQSVLKGIIKQLPQLSI